MMKKLLFILILITALGVGCSNQTNKVVVNKDLNFKQLNKVPEKIAKRKVIIVNSVNDPLSTELNNVQSTQNETFAQQIPNVNPEDPLVLTKMPYSENKSLK